jgi:protein phosphatase
MFQISKVFSLLDAGKRSSIEDYIYPNLNDVNTKTKVFVVCDGVGGEAKGEEASKIVAETFGKMLSHLTNITKEDILAALDASLLRFKLFIEDFPEAENMSTTLTLACINKREIIVAWCGDSKIVHFNDKGIKWKSLDHSFVQHLVNINQISLEEASTHPQRNLITRCINLQTTTNDFDFHVIDSIEPNDYLLLASDGIFEKVSTSLLPQIAQNPEPNKGYLINEYCQNYTRDNYSMHLLQFEATKSNFLPKIIMGLIILVGLGIWQFTKTQNPKIPPTPQNKRISVAIPTIIPPAVDSTKNH